MSIASVIEDGGIVTITIVGQLIIGNRQDLKNLIHDALERGGRKFVIDCAKTGYIDSSGLGALVSMARKVRETGGELRIAALNEDLQSLFELTKLDTLFKITDTVEQALQGF